MCILELLIDVENFKAICKNSRVISLTKIDCLCIYLMAIVFNDSSSFEVLKQYQSFFFFLFVMKKGLLLRNNQSWEFVFFFMCYNNLKGYPAEIFMERLFTTLFV